jgi:hypothetical protein
MKILHQLRARIQRSVGEQTEHSRRTGVAVVRHGWPASQHPPGESDGHGVNFLIFMRLQVYRLALRPDGEGALTRRWRKTQTLA